LSIIQDTLGKALKSPVLFIIWENWERNARVFRSHEISILGLMPQIKN
jgi:hypothetical protein